MNYSDNAVMAKVRAQYGKRLSRADYEQLMQKKSVNEVAAYLKNETSYGYNLREVREDLIHRGQLEALLRRRTLDTYYSLLKYSYEDPLFLRMYLMRNEIDQLLVVIRLLNAGEINHYIISLPGYLSSHMAFDLFALAKITDYDGLLDVVSHSHYHEILGKFRPLAGQHIDITGCENALLSYYYGELLRLVQEGPYNKRTRQDLLKLLHMQIDFHNVSVIYRMKSFFAGPKTTAKFIEKIRACMLPYRSAVTPAQYEALLEARSIPELFQLIGQIKALQGYPTDMSLDSGHIVCQTYRVRQRMNQRIFRFSTSPAVVVLSYLNLLEIEINNLTNIIEGIRYEVSPDELRSLITVI